MRQSNRSKILEAAMRVVERDGVTAVTFEAVAAEAGLTKGGLLYHFPAKEALIEALHRDMAERWERALEAEGGNPATAYVRLAARTATRAELALMVDAASQPQRHQPWAEVAERWAPTPVEPDDAGLDRIIARLATDGLWLNESVGATPLDPALRQRVIDRICSLVDRAEPDRSRPGLEHRDVAVHPE
ncbi:MULTISPECIES: TetR/AcrR family transcriptional regulator [Actinoplanes]|uniref:TetR/AcrR family transcriptional regulator n=1 Tax=Actinoplanes TaxID=1865 RepID=UPI0005F2FE43|nr:MULTISPECIES: TetR/AcrR family transcriptional regulator [Actinoplanes]GLY00448.1 transcriptional regulator [Actinoplanes sp. NBRC 101535]